jgi:hypothetical protein
MMACLVAIYQAGVNWSRQREELQSDCHGLAFSSGTISKRLPRSRIWARIQGRRVNETNSGPTAKVHFLLTAVFFFRRGVGMSISFMLPKVKCCRR